MSRILDVPATRGAAMRTRCESVCLLNRGVVCLSVTMQYERGPWYRVQGYLSHCEWPREANSVREMPVGIVFLAEMA